MLVLTRKNNEQIRIGDNITISILKVRGNSVRVGIQAPRDVRVIRGELPVFDATENEAPAEVATDNTPVAAVEVADEEPAISELEWIVMKRLAETKRKSCHATGRRCSSEMRRVMKAVVAS